MLGDSLTQGWSDSGQKDLWKKYFEPVKAANFGIGGDRTQQVLWRINNGELDGITPKVVVLMIGINNMWTKRRVGKDFGRDEEDCGDAAARSCLRLRFCCCRFWPAGQSSSDAPTRKDCAGEQDHGEAR